jgi:hypothetical protein
MGRWIKIYDGLLEWGWHTRPEMVSLFVHLLLKANVKDGHFEGIEVRRGQLVTSRKELSVLTGISEQSIRTCLKHLQETGEIVIKSTKRFSVISICKYEDYQSKKEPAQPTTNQRLTNNQPTPNQHLTTSIECKIEDNKREDVNNPSSSLSSSPFAELTPDQQQQEKFLFFEIFFFKNYGQLKAEVERFVASNEANLWRNKSGKPFTTRAQRLALAELWKQQPAQDPRIKVNGFLSAWKKAYERCKAERPELARAFLDTRTDCKTSNVYGHQDELQVYCKKSVFDWLWQDDERKAVLMEPMQVLLQAYRKKEVRFYPIK